MESLWNDCSSQKRILVEFQVTVMICYGATIQLMQLTLSNWVTSLGLVESFDNIIILRDGFLFLECFAFELLWIEMVDFREV